MLNLDAQQSRQVAEAIKRESETVDKRLQETYCWLIVPQQPDRNQKVTLEQERLSAAGEFLQRAARKLKNNEWLIDGLSPDNLLMELEPLDIWKQAPHLKIKTLWDWLTNYCYLPRLFRSVTCLEADHQRWCQQASLPAFRLCQRAWTKTANIAGLTIERVFHALL